MYKIGIIGDRESVLCFSALGFAVFEVEDAKSAETVLKTKAFQQIHSQGSIYESFHKGRRDRRRARGR